MDELDFEEWLAYGYAKGWVGVPVCATHDGVPMTASEEQEFETGDPCVHVMRAYASTDEKRDVEENHSPSVWRASNRYGSEGTSTVE